MVLYAPVLLTYRHDITSERNVQGTDITQGRGMYRGQTLQVRGMYRDRKTKPVYYAGVH